MKLGCRTYIFSKDHYEPPYLEFIVSDAQDLYGYYTPARIRELHRAREKAALAHFERGVDIAGELGSRAVNLVSPWPQQELSWATHKSIKYLKHKEEQI